MTFPAIGTNHTTSPWTDPVTGIEWVYTESTNKWSRYAEPSVSSWNDLTDRPAALLNQPAANVEGIRKIGAGATDAMAGNATPTASALSFGSTGQEWRMELVDNNASFTFGTGAAAEFLSQVGALPLSGGTLTGALVAPGVTVNPEFGAEQAPALSNANWSDAANWSHGVGDNTLTHAAGSTVAITQTGGAAIVAGTTYKVVITTTGLPAGTTWTLGVIAGKSITEAGTITDYVTASTTGKLIITPASAAFVVTEISIVAVTANTGKTDAFGGIRLAGRITSANGTNGLRVIDSGTVLFDGSIGMNGSLSGATTGAFSSIVTQTTAAITTTPIAGFQTVAAVSSGAATVRYSPSLLMSGEGWASTPQTSMTNAAEFYVIPTTHANTTTGTVVCATRTVNDSASASNLFSCTFAGGFAIPGTLDVTGITAVGRLHVGGASDPGDNNALIDGTLQVVGNTTVAAYSETLVAIPVPAGSSRTLSITDGTFLTATLTASIECSFTMPPVGIGKSFVLLLKQAPTTGGGAAGFTGVKWPGGVDPIITTTAGKMDLLSFVSDGTNWYGSIVQNYTP